ncbi:MAG: sulfatase [Anaerolineales bacterium]|nr:sulfatase [Anaerolineales bacterium]
MKKRQFVFALALVVTACAAEDISAPYNPPTPIVSHEPTIFDIDIPEHASEERLNDPRPNIILVMTDDQPYHTVDYMPFVKTELIKNGVQFENGVVTTPLCCPSRSSILSGQYAHNHNVLTNTLPLGGATKFDPSLSFSILMQEVGYRTAYFGKYLNNYEDVQPYGAMPPGWDVWKVFLSKNLSGGEEAGHMQYYYRFSQSENGAIVEYKNNEQSFSADVVTRNALEFIRDSVNEPFFMTVGYYNPHSPYIWAPRHKDSFRASTNWDWVLYRPPSFNEKDIRDKPDYISDLSPLSEDELNTAHLQILRSLLSVDDGVASIVAALEKAGLDENTIIVYISDNGMTLGDHRFGVTKNCPYESCIKIPFIVYAPGYFEARTDTNLVANIDLYPTFATWAGFDVPETVDGESMAALLEDPSTPWRDEILLEHWPTEDGVGSLIPEFYSIRTHEWKYTEYSTREVELYDLVNDPYELLNVAGKRDYRDIQAELKVRLQELKKE